MNRLDRQSFLGAHSPMTLRSATVGVVGLGGGGSHVVQQLAHIGIGRFVLADPDSIELTNTNRLIGGRLEDVERGRAKVDIAHRVIQEVNPEAEVVRIHNKWSEDPDKLKLCDLLVGAVDSYSARDELERFSRRYLIPYVDMGMDVHDLQGGRYLISGQVILSTPGNPCLRCCRLVREDLLKNEAGRYGEAGGQPQVVWPNGVLASTAVGVAMQLLTPWNPNPPSFVYMEYDGNKGTVSVSQLAAYLEKLTCEHYSDDATGDPFFDVGKCVSGGPQVRDSRWAVVVRSLFARKFLKRLLARISHHKRLHGASDSQYL